MSLPEAVTPPLSGLPLVGKSAVSVLIVDDEAGGRETLFDILTDKGYEAEMAATGEEALARVRERFFNVAVLDIRLPDMNGTDLLTQVKEVRPDTACIMVTGFANIQSSIRATNAGAYAYILKPIDIQQLETVLGRALHQQSLQLENRRLLRRYEALSDVTDTALTTLNLDNLLRPLLDRFIDHLKMDAGAILLLDETGTRPEQRAVAGLDEAEFVDGALSLEGFLGRIAQVGRPLLEGDHQEDGRVPCSEPSAWGLSTVLGVPLRVQERLIGVVQVGTREPHHFTSEEIELFAVLADRAALLIENARLYEQERRRHREAEEMAERQRQIAREVTILYDVSTALARSMSVEERLDALAGYLIQVMGVRRCVIWLSEHEALAPRTLVGVSAAEREKMRRVRIAPEEFGPSLKAALARNDIVVVPDAASTALVTNDLPRQWNMRSVMLLPMVYSGRTIGVAWLDDPGRLREFSDQHRRLAEAIAGQAAVAIEYAQAFEQQTRVASTFQQSFLPRRAPQPGHFEIETHYEPASAAEQVGGDYFDFVELGDHRLGIVMGDVCGKGVTAAMFTAMAKYELRAYAMEDPSPASVMTRLNRSLYTQMSEECMFITMVFGILDTRTGEFTYVNAAHPHPLLYQPNGEVIELGTTGGMVGALPHMLFEEAKTRLEPGAVLLVYTDGVSEARTGLDMLEIQGVQEALRQAGGGSAKEVCDAVLRRAVEFSGGALKDDVAIVAVRAQSAPS
jgi:serine phosphatase RsbU (regulator of sigma subunit)/ActR/RegA family two-component response regulator